MQSRRMKGLDLTNGKPHMTQAGYLAENKSYTEADGCSYLESWSD